MKDEEGRQDWSKDSGPISGFSVLLTAEIIQKWLEIQFYSRELALNYLGLFPGMEKKYQRGFFKHVYLDRDRLKR